MREQAIILDRASLEGAGREILKNWWVVLCWMVAMLLGATGVGNLLYTPQYTASSTLVIRMMGADAYTSLTQTTQMTAVYSEIFQSDALRNLVSESIGEPVEGTISCTQIEETNLLVLSTTSPTPRQAYLFIQAALRNYQQVAGYVFTDAALEVVQEPSVPESPSNASFLVSRRWELTLMAGLAAAGLITLIYLLRRTVKAASSASSLLDGNILGTIPFEKKQVITHGEKGKKEVPALLLNSPLVSMDFAEASRRMATRLESHMRRKNCKVLLVCSVEENEGKSTVAANIALALGEHGREVLLLDGDLRKPSQFKVFDKREEAGPSFSDVLEGSTALENCLAQNKTSAVWGLFQYKPVSQAGELLSSPRLHQILEELRGRMDVIVVDCPPIVAAADAEIWMHQADTVALVVRQDSSDIRVINDTVDLIWKSAGDFAGIVLNAFRRESPRVSESGRYE